MKLKKREREQNRTCKFELCYATAEMLEAQNIRERFSGVVLCVFFLSIRFYAECCVVSSSSLLSVQALKKCECISRGHTQLPLPLPMRMT